MRDFVSASEETSGGRLARWLQPESVVDPCKSQLIFPGVFSASVATFGVPSGITVGNFQPSSPVKAIEKGSTITNPRNLWCSHQMFDILDEEDEKTVSEATTTSTTTVISEGLRVG